MHAGSPITGSRLFAKALLGMEVKLHQLQLAMDRVVGLVHSLNNSRASLVNALGKLKAFSQTLLSLLHPSFLVAADGAVCTAVVLRGAVSATSRALVGVAAAIAVATAKGIAHAAEDAG